MPVEQKFLGVRIPVTLKERLEKEAEERGTSLQELCKELLDGRLKRNPAAIDNAIEAVETHAGELESLADEIQRLERKREELEAMIDERSGLFQQAPASLKVALRAAEQRIKEATQKLNALCPLVAKEHWTDWI